MKTTVNKTMNVPSPCLINGFFYAKLKGTDCSWMRIEPLRGVLVTSVITEEMAIDAAQVDVSDFNEALRDVLDILRVHADNLEFDF